TNVVGVAVADGEAMGTILNDDPVQLGNGTSATGISGSIGQQFLYSMAVPLGASNLSFTTTGDLGDVDLYVKFGSAPTTTVFDCSSTTPTTDETCNISPAQAGTYYILLNAYTDISGVTLTGRYTLASLSIDDVSVTEGNSGTSLATFTVTINGDATVEANETFLVNLGTPVGATIADSQAIGTIINDDGPTLSIADVSITEGDKGTRLATFTVKLSQAAASAVTYNIATADATAIADSDYVPRSLVGETIAAGLTSKTFAVELKGDTTAEANETFMVNLNAAVGATIADFRAIGTIINDDANSDILWRNSSTGANMLWRSANAATVQSMTGVSSQAWKIVGIGDFSGDGKDDVLWRNTSTGANTIWKSADSTAVQSMGGVNPTLGWQIVGVGNFNGDGRDDVLWRNTSSGANTIWKSANSATVQPMTGLSDLAWKIVGVGDFDGDGKDDVLWRNSSTGANTIWKSANSATIQSVTSVYDLAWKIVGVGDFNGDGRDDVLWRNSNTGANTIWRSANAASVQSMTGVTNLDWHIVGTGDYNGDGKDDVLWRNFSAGTNTIWKSANPSTLQG